MPEVSDFSAVLDNLYAAAEPQPIQKLMYDRKSAAFALSISQRSLDYLVSLKKIDFRKFGSKVMFSHAALVKFSRQDHASLSE